MKRLLLLILLVCLAPRANADAVPQITTKADFDQVVARLNQPNTKAAALKELIGFAGFQVICINADAYHGIRDPKIHALQIQAQAVVNAHEDIDTVAPALNSSDEGLRYWGVRIFPPLSTYPQIDKRWLTLLPKIEGEANSSNSAIRRTIYETLSCNRSEQGLLMNRLAVETEPANIIDLIFDANSAPYGSAAAQTLFLSQFVPLLQSKDTNVRLDALDFISLNNQDAPMYRVTFDDAVYHSVAALTLSSSKTEQRVAGYAIEALQRQNTATANPAAKP